MLYPGSVSSTLSQRGRIMRVPQIDCKIDLNRRLSKAISFFINKDWYKLVEDVASAFQERKTRKVILCCFLILHFLIYVPSCYLLKNGLLAHCIYVFIQSGSPINHNQNIDVTFGAI